MWAVKDVNLFDANGQIGKEHATRMFPDAEFESYHEAREEAMRRSFINSATPSDIINPAGEVVASALDGWCRTGQWFDSEIESAMDAVIDTAARAAYELAAQ